MQHSKGHIFEIAWSFATEWMRAIDMFEYRLLTNLAEDEKFFEHKAFREDVDFHCFLTSLNRFRRAIKLAHKRIENKESKEELGRAIETFDDAIPSLAVFRNVGEHFDDYILQEGKDKSIDSRGLRVYHAGVNEDGHYVVHWLEFEIDTHNAKIEAFKLYKKFCDWYNAKAKTDYLVEN